MYSRQLAYRVLSQARPQICRYQQHLRGSLYRFSTQAQIEKEELKEEWLTEEAPPGHFKERAHPMVSEKTWVNPTYTHVWSENEIEECRNNQPHHLPKSTSDKFLYHAVRVCYHAFNFITGFRKANPSPQSLVYRLIILESVAGVPPMVAAGLRHFGSLRNLKRDHGWIHTLLGEAENERMHLLVVMNRFDAGVVTRVMVITAQTILIPSLTLVGAISPKLLHRFVGYLEETAVRTYSDIVAKIETPGTKLHKQWGGLTAPQIAITYWRLPQNAMWLDVCKQMLADEAHHRDVNHTFADMEGDDPNPYVEEHHKDARKAWQHMENAVDQDSYLKTD